MAKVKEQIVSSCERCGALCCKHVALEIDKPTTKSDFDHIRWYLLHEGVEIFIEDNGSWNLKFQASCKKVRKDGKCGIYGERPHICRGYPPEDRECEFEGEEPYYKVRFTSAEEFETYMDSKKKNWRFTKD
ncbi:MAG TPA: YkgJ family cysteine cluster protein [Spirochaetota bacterium]